MTPPGAVDEGNKDGDEGKDEGEEEHIEGPLSFDELPPPKQQQNRASAREKCIFYI